MLRCLIFLIITALLSSCAKLPHQELDAAEYMVGRAYAMQAMEFAPTEYQAAKAALADARKSLQETDYGDARDSLEFSLKHSRRAIVLTEENKARRAVEEAQRALEEEKARQVVQETVKPPKTVPKAEAPPAPPKPAPAPKITLLSGYNVGEGETLWTISAHPQVYNEGLLWPLLYQANRDQIKDPRQIFPGQTLSIRRDMTEKDLEDARQRARESDIFPVPDSVVPKQ
ncbi:MAG: LysM peptidoglycan-binding domain-containing protein [Desulfuromonadales bacterium]|jgi:nucleoid-associated protein YgaU|nr:LysM peptidoglycan-binding domain-containing protein [Desulfuromonadales bacterium]